MAAPLRYWLLLSTLLLSGPAFGEAGPPAGVPNLPLLQDPSLLLDEEPMIPPEGLTVEPFAGAPEAPGDLGKKLETPPAGAEPPAAPPVTLVPVRRKEGVVTLPDPSLASPVALPSAAVAPEPMVEPEPPKPAAAPNLAPPTLMPPSAPPPRAAASETPPVLLPPEEKPTPKETLPSFAQVSNVSGPEVAILLADGRFRPARIRIRRGEKTRLLFTAVAKRPAALIIERLNVQRWMSRAEEPRKRQLASLPWEVNREVNANRITEVVLDPAPGTYTFHDAISGAAGEIIVE